MRIESIWVLFDVRGGLIVISVWLDSQTNLIRFRPSKKIYLALFHGVRVSAISRDLKSCLAVSHWQINAFQRENVCLERDGNKVRGDLETEIVFPFPTLSIAISLTPITLPQRLPSFQLKTMRSDRSRIYKKRYIYYGNIHNHRTKISIYDCEQPLFTSTKKISLHSRSHE